MIDKDERFYDDLKDLLYRACQVQNDKDTTYRFLSTRSLCEKAAGIFLDVAHPDNVDCLPTKKMFAKQCAASENPEFAEKFARFKELSQMAKTDINSMTICDYQEYRKLYKLFEELNMIPENCHQEIDC